MQRILLCTLLSTCVPAVAGAQGASASPPRLPDPLSIAPASDPTQFRSGRAPLTLTLSRPLAASDGELVVLAGDMDVTALVTVRGTSLLLTPGPFPLPAGESELVLYLVRDRRAQAWTPIASIPLRVARAGGFSKALTTPSMDLNATGLLSDGSSDPLAPRGDRRQDVTLAGGVRSVHERPDFAIETQASVVGAARDERTLRFAERGDDAPKVDLAAYQLTARRGSTRLDVGHLSVGSNRLLLNAFSSRGVALTSGPAWAQLTVASVAGAPIVGWDNPIGIAESRHRMNSAVLTMEIVRTRPGAVQLRLSALDGALEPRTGFAQGAVVDAEASRGAGFELSASTPAQRARMSVGLARSDFANPARDSALTGGLAVPTAPRDRRTARYAEASATVFGTRRLFGTVPAGLNIVVRHERVNPLYRSVGTFVQADREQDGVDLSGVLDVVNWQAGVARGRDNLAAVPSVLTSRTKGVSSTASFESAALLRMRTRTALFPQVSVAYSTVHQFALAPPSSSDFRPQDLADQVIGSVETTARWGVPGWRTSARVVRSWQDNRQVERERADFAGSNASLSLERVLRAALSASLDLGLEHQRNVELAEITRVRRVGTTVQWHPWPRTAVSTNITAAVSRPPGVRADRVGRGVNRDNTNVELRAELAQTLRLSGRGTSDATVSTPRTAQLFLRLARTTVTALPASFGADATVPALRATTLRWTLNSGLSLKAW